MGASDTSGTRVARRRLHVNKRQVAATRQPQGSTKGVETDMAPRPTKGSRAQEPHEDRRGGEGSHGCPTVHDDCMEKLPPNAKTERSRDGLQRSLRTDNQKTQFTQRGLGWVPAGQTCTQQPKQVQSKERAVGEKTAFCAGGPRYQENHTVSRGTMFLTCG